MTSDYIEIPKPKPEPEAMVGRRTKPSYTPTPPAGILGVLTGQQAEDPRVVRKAKQRMEIFRVLAGLATCVVICATILGIVWACTH